MKPSTTKPWDWSKNKDGKWLVPCPEAAFLAERWREMGLSRFLDLGCGLGRHSVYMALHGFNTTAVDLSYFGVDNLNKWAAKEGLSIKTRVCNMLSLPFDDDSFDCIMAYNVIYHTDTSGFIRTIEEIQRVLKPGGEVFLTLISKNTWSFQHAESFQRLDANTLLRNEHETEKDVPHFYADIGDINNFFGGWIFADTPREWAEYNRERPEFYSKHWALLLRK